MSGQEAESRILFSVVLSDANIVFSRVLRDYVLYAMTHQLIRVRWSQAILDEAVRRMIEKVDGFDEASGERHHVRQPVDLGCPARLMSRRLSRFEVPGLGGQPISWKPYSSSPDCCAAGSG